MPSFLTRHASEAKGTLSGFDRVRFRGTLRLTANLRGLSRWMSYHGMLLKSFKEVTMGFTETIKEQSRMKIPVSTLEPSFPSACQGTEARDQGSVFLGPAP